MEVADPGKDSQKFPERVEESEKRKIRRRRQRYEQNAWFGLGMFGVVGWSVAIPVLAGIALGVWIDVKTESQYSWTLMLLLVGVVIGSMNAWFWVNRERNKIMREREENGDEH